MTLLKKDGFGHENPYEGDSNDWITPKWIIDGLTVRIGAPSFDLDPCASLTQPWPCANRHYTVQDDGLLSEWAGGVWLNPPYGPHTATWIEKMAKYPDGGIALIFARTETRLWQEHIFPTASGFLFPNKRIAFYRPDGTLPKSSSGAPSALISWGEDFRERLMDAWEKGTVPGSFLPPALRKR